MDKERLRKIKLVVSDIDGTLMDENRLLSESFVQLVQQLRDKGVAFTFASGRLPYKITPLMEQLNSTVPFVACNGACIYEKEELLFQKCFPIKILRSVIDGAMKQGDTVLYSINGIEYCMAETEDSARKRKERGVYYPIRPITEDEWNILEVVKVNILAHSTIKVLQPLLKTLDLLMITTYGEKGIEIVSAEADKSEAIQKILSQFDYSLEEVLAIGDNENDEKLLKSAGIGVAVKNAIPEIKKIADTVTLREGENGVMDVLERLVSVKEE